MQDKSTYLLAADSEGEMDDWISTLNKILHSSFELVMQEKRNGDLHDGMCVCVCVCVGVCVCERERQRKEEIVEYLSRVCEFVRSCLCMADHPCFPS